MFTVVNTFMMGKPLPASIALVSTIRNAKKGRNVMHYNITNNYLKQENTFNILDIDPSSYHSVSSQRCQQGPKMMYHNKVSEVKKHFMGQEWIKSKEHISFFLSGTKTFRWKQITWKHNAHVTNKSFVGKLCFSSTHSDIYITF